MSKYRANNLTPRCWLIAMLSRRIPAYVYTSRSGLTKGLKRKGGLGFLSSRSAETEEVKFLREFDFSGKVVYDLGGFHGLMTIFFAKTARQVITYEANPENIMRIYDNVKVNRFDNVLVRNVAVSAEDGVLKLLFDPLLSGAATGDPVICASVMRESSHVQAFSVAMTSLDDDIRRLRLPPPDFIKIDIEGMELKALQGMCETLRTKRPDLYIELHGTTLENKQENAILVMSLLVQFDYEIVNVETRQTITSGKLTGCESHIYCCSRKTAFSFNAAATA